MFLLRKTILLENIKESGRHTTSLEQHHCILKMAALSAASKVCRHVCSRHAPSAKVHLLQSIGGAVRTEFPQVYNATTI